MSGLANVAVHVRFRGGLPKDKKRMGFSVDGSKTMLSLKAPVPSDAEKPAKSGPTAADLERKKDADIRKFQFDHIFSSESTQEEVAQQIFPPMVEHVWDGYNSCCFAYGQTGSGKTYSIFGEEAGVHKGFVPRVVERIFDMTEKRKTQHQVLVFASFVEIYLERIRDLGDYYYRKREEDRKGGGKRGGSRPGSAGRPKRGEVDNDQYTEPLEIRQDDRGNVFVQGLKRPQVTSVDEVMEMIEIGLEKRQTYGTEYNAVSSRSHTVFTLTMVRKDLQTHETVSGMINLVDLAGSERLPTQFQAEEERVRETKSINSSLSALGKVVMALNSGKMNHIPYRDSKLTRILQNSLGGNSYTTLLATCNPLDYAYEETLRTLQFASRCRNVTNKVHVNYVTTDVQDLQHRIQKLQSEVAILRTDLSVKETKVAQLTVANERLKKRAKGRASVSESGSSEPFGDGALSEDGMSDAGSTVYGRGSMRMTDISEESGGDGGSQFDMDSSMGGSASVQDGDVVGGGSRRSPRGGGKGDARMRQKVKTLQKQLQEYKTKVRKAASSSQGALSRAQADRRAADAARAEMKAREQAYQKRESDLAQQHTKRLAQQSKDRAAMERMEEKVKEKGQKLVQMQAELNKHKEAHKKSMEERLQVMINKERKVMKHMRKQYGLPASPGGESLPELMNENDAKRLIAEGIKKAVDAERERWITQHDQMRLQLMEQFASIKAQKVKELKDYAGKVRVYKEEKKSQHRALKKEIEYLYHYIHNVSKIVQNMESGMYDIQVDRSGLKCFIVPTKDLMKMELCAERCSTLRKQINKMKKFCNENHLREPNLERLFVKPGGGTGDAGAGSSGASAPALTRGKFSVQDAATSPKNAAVATVENMRESMLVELSSHQTVRYIKQLEDKVIAFQRKIAESSMQTLNLRNSLSSANRLLDTQRRRDNARSRFNKFCGHNRASSALRMSSSLLSRSERAFKLGSYRSATSRPASSGGTGMFSSSSSFASSSRNVSRPVSSHGYSKPNTGRPHVLAARPMTAETAPVGGGLQGQENMGGHGFAHTSDRVNSAPWGRKMHMRR